MRTISKDYFVKFFMEISQKLTIAELRMLYLLITEPDVMKLSQQEFGNKIKAHRRTINIGIMKLKKYRFLEDDYLDVRMKNLDDHQNDHSKKIVSEQEKKHARNFIIASFKKFYYPVNEEVIIVNEDFYSTLLGNYGLQQNLKYNKEFITETIEGVYPKCRFHFKQGKPSDISDLHFDIILYINRDIINSRKHDRYYLDKDKLLRFLSDSHSINEEDVRFCIKKYFKKLVIVKNRIKIPKPWRGKQYVC